jgi:hypothetical protein
MGGEGEGSEEVYWAEEVREAVDGACPCLVLPQTTRCVYRGHLDHVAVSIDYSFGHAARISSASPLLSLPCSADGCTVPRCF